MIAARWLLLALLCVAPVIVHADTDYQCLNQCVNGGKTAADCMTSCTYNNKPKPIAIGTVAPQEKKNHHVLSTPLPAGDQIMLNPAKPHVEIPTKDWGCMKWCLQQSTPYSSCEEQCTLTDGKLPATTTYNPQQQ